MSGSCVQVFLDVPEQRALAQRIAQRAQCPMLISSGVFPDWNLRRFSLGDPLATELPWTLHFLLGEPIDSAVGREPNLGRADAALGPLSLSGGRLVDGVLEETVCGFKTNVDASAAKWRPFMSWLRRYTMAGAVAKVSAAAPGTFYKNCRVSSGALAAFHRGIVLKQLRQQLFWFEPRPTKHIVFPLEPERS